MRGLLESEPLLDLSGYDAAEKLHRQALAIQRKALGAEHPDVKNSMMGLEMIREELNAP